MQVFTTRTALLALLAVTAANPCTAFWSNPTEDMHGAFTSALESVYVPGWKAGLVASDEFKKMKVDEETKISRFIRSTCLTQAAAAAGANIIPGVGIPVGMAISLQTQVGLATGIANIRGYDMSSPEKCRPLIGMFLVGDLTAEVTKVAGGEGAKAAAKGLLTQVNGKALIAINKQVGMRLFTKNGAKGVFNLGSMIPGFGIAIAGIVDGGFCIATANGIEAMTFRGKTKAQRCMADILDDFGAAHMKIPVISKMGINSDTFCKGLPLTVLRASLDDTAMVDNYLSIMGAHCNSDQELMYPCANSPKY